MISDERIKQIINEEISKTDVEAIVSRKLSSSYDSRDFKRAVKEVTAGYECGMSVVKFNDIKEGDIFECFVMQEVKR